MDYKNLEYFIKAQKLNKKQAYWILYLSRFYLEACTRNKDGKGGWT